MSYSLSEFSPWSVMMFHTWNNDEVYVLRLRVTGVSLAEPSQLLRFAAAAGRTNDNDLDVRAVGCWKQPGMPDNAWVIDVVMTSQTMSAKTIKPGFSDDAGQMAEKVNSDPDLRAVFPQMAVDTKASEFGELTGPKDSIDLWRSMPLLWDRALTSPKGKGGPTEAYVSPDDFHLFKGQADAGRAAQPWKASKPDGKKDDKESEDDMTAWYVLGALAVAVVGLSVWKRKQER